MTMNTMRRKFIAGVGAAAASTAVQAAKHLPKAINRSEPRRCFTKRTDADSMRNPSWHLGKGARQRLRKQLRRRGEAPQCD
jgi:hypothetical protein